MSGQMFFVIYYNILPQYIAYIRAQNKVLGLFYHRLNKRKALHNYRLIEFFSFQQV